MCGGGGSSTSIGSPGRTSPAVSDDAHDAGLADQVALGVAVEHGGHQPRLDAVELVARVAQAGDLDDRLVAEAQARPGRQPSRSTPRVVTFSPIWPARHVEAAGPQLVVQLGVDEVDLAQVGLRRVALRRASDA